MEEDHTRACRLYGGAESIRQGIGSPPEFLLSDKRARLLAETRQRFGEEACRTEYEAGAAMSFTQTVDYALEQTAGAL